MAYVLILNYDSDTLLYSRYDHEYHYLSLEYFQY